MADDVIRTNLIAGGWNAELIDPALKGEMSDVPPPPPAPTVAAQATPPVAVVQNFSTRGLEYVIMFISLWVSASSIGFLAHQALSNAFGVNSDSYSFLGFDQMSIAALVVALPIFTILFLRLKKAERNDPTVKNDPSRKRAVQLTLIITFLIGLGNVIGYVYSLITPPVTNTYDAALVGSGQSGIINLGHTAITLIIAGGIFAYYWHDEHKKAD